MTPGSLELAQTPSRLFNRVATIIVNHDSRQSIRNALYRDLKCSCDTGISLRVNLPGKKDAVNAETFWALVQHFCSKKLCKLAVMSVMTLDKI